MKKVLVLVEGQSEEWFVKNILNSNFNQKNIFFIPTILTTKRVLSGPNYKGGVSTYTKINRELLKLFNDSSATIVTTMLDYYRIPADFPGFNEKPSGDCYQRVKFLEDKFYRDVNRRNFIPYLQLHEFEALILSQIEKFEKVFPGNIEEIEKLRKLIEAYRSPEEINENPQTAVSKRIKSIFPEYEKILHGQLILMGAKLYEIRSKCPHFDSWLKKIEDW